jgi:stage II sporulation protein D
VRVGRIRRASATLTIGSDGQWIELSSAAGPSSQERATRLFEPSPIDVAVSVLHAPLRVNVRSGAWSITDAAGYRASVGGFDALDVRPMTFGGPAELRFNDLSYPGFLRLVPRSDHASGSYDVINHVELEQYLPGVLTRELFSHWRPTTFAAQAVAARSFACSEASFFRDRRHFDLHDTTASQVYSGRSDHQRALDAVEQTCGMVLAYNAALVPGYYSSCCGGRAANAVDAIGEHPYNDVPPLHGRSGADVCKEAPRYAWTIERPRSGAARRLAAFGRVKREAALAAVERIAAIDVASENAHGRPRSYLVRRDDGAAIELPAERLRAALNWPVGGEPPAQPLHSSYVSVGFERRRARIDGHGHGHGAGLCQYGAEALARQGNSFEAILRWYYPGVELIRAYA